MHCKTLFKMNLMTYSSKKQLRKIQKSRAPDLITPCYRTGNLHYARYKQSIWQRLYRLLLHKIWLEGIRMIFIFFIRTSKLFLLVKIWILWTNDTRSINVWRCAFFSYISLSFGRIFIKNYLLLVKNKLLK